MTAQSMICPKCGEFIHGGPMHREPVAGWFRRRMTLPGFASVLAGVRLSRFLGEGEARWIRMIEALASRDSQR